jgi:hypothetical protein
MSKKFTDQLMKFEITKDKLKMEISLKDLVFLFENSPNNFQEYDTEPVKIKRGKKQEFAEFVVKMLMEYSRDDENDTRWGRPFEEVFSEIFDGYEEGEEFCKYSIDEEDE